MNYIGCYSSTILLQIYIGPITNLPPTVVVVMYVDATGTLYQHDNYLHLASCDDRKMNLKPHSCDKTSIFKTLRHSQ